MGNQHDNTTEASAGLSAEALRLTAALADRDATIAQLTAANGALVVRVEEARVIVKAMLSRDTLNTCQHDNTHRGGFLWEICEDCSGRWADDMGGKPEWRNPSEWVAARAWLAGGA